MRVTTIAGLACLILQTGAAVAGERDMFALLNTCQALDVGGLAIASDTGCVRIEGKVEYEFTYGNTEGEIDAIGANELAYGGDFISYDAGDTDPTGSADWGSSIETSLKFTAYAPSDFGTTITVIELEGENETTYVNGVFDDLDDTLELSQAYVQIGDKTRLTAGFLDDSVLDKGDDDALGWLEPHIADDASGVGFANDAGGTYDLEGHAIQFLSELDNGVSVAAALEALDETGSAIAVLSYEDDLLSGHFSAIAGDILDGQLNDFAVHTGATLMLDTNTVRAAFASNDTGWWNALVSGEAAFDRYAVAATADFTSEREWGGTISGEAEITRDFMALAGVRWLDSDTAIDDDEGFEIRGGFEYGVAETVALALEVGHLWTGAAAVNGAQAIWDVDASLEWTPGGHFSTELSAEANSHGAYALTLGAEKKFH